MAMVRQEGHDIPDDTIIRRYPRVMYNFIKIYMPLCDKIFYYDNSGLKPILIFKQDRKGCRILKQELYTNILRYADDNKRNG